MNRVKKLLCWMVVVVSVIAVFSVPVEAETVSRYGTYYGLCDYHEWKGKSSCMHVKLCAEFDTQSKTGYATDAFFSSIYMHWPNGVRVDSTYCGYKYGRGTYTQYCSLITAWIELAIDSRTNTLYAYY